MKLLKTVLICLVIVGVFGGAMFALNLHTGPIIAQHLAGAAAERLNAVMPDGKGFEDITATLKGVPANVVKVHRETSGKGFVVECTATSQYTQGAPMDIVIAVDATGKISGIKLFSITDNAPFAPEYPDTYIGKDSSLAGIEVTNGATYSSKAFKEAVENALNVLISNNLIVAGKKSDEQILTEMIPSLHTGLVSGGVMKATTLEASGNIVAGYKALNDSGFAFIVKSNDATFLAIVNAIGNCTVYDTTGADVTEANTAVCEEAIAAATLKDFEAAAQKMLLKSFADATNITAIDFAYASNVVYAASFQSGGNTYYAFYSCPLTYGDHAMAICTVLDENGAIVSQDVKEFLFGHGVDYLPIYGQGFGNVSSETFKEYENSFAGITSGTLTDDILVSGATMSSTAVKLATQDAFALFDTIKGGN